jgi:hypothetical protein
VPCLCEHGLAEAPPALIQADTDRLAARLHPREEVQEQVIQYIYAHGPAPNVWPEWTSGQIPFAHVGMLVSQNGLRRNSPLWRWRPALNKNVIL